MRFSKRSILVILFVVVFKNYQAIAQNHFPVDSAVWHYEYYENTTLINVDYTITGDTSLNGRNYTILDNFGLKYLLREDSNRIYIRYLDTTGFSCATDSDLLAYDFNLQVNDSIYLKNCQNDSELAVVTNRDSVWTNFGYRQRLKLEGQFNWITCLTSFETYWIEGIGGSEDLFYLLNFSGPFHMCYHFYQFDSLTIRGVNIVLNLNSELKKPIFISWDPNKKILTSDIPIKNIIIFDVCGSEIFKNDYKSIYTIPIEVINFNKFYFLLITLDDGRVVTKKIISF